MDRTLPAVPNLEQLKNQAKDLLKAQRDGQEDACAAIAAELPRLQGTTASEVAEARLTLRDAQTVVARGYGFSTWAKLAKHVEQVLEGSVGERLKRLDGADPAVAKAIRTLLDEPRQAAIVLVFLGEVTAAEIMRRLSDAEIEAVTRAIGALAEITESEEAEALKAFETLLAAGPTRSRSGPREAAYGQFAHRALARAVGPDRAGQILARQGVEVADPPPPKLDADQLQKKHRLLESLRQTPTQDLSLEELQQVLVALAEIALAEGFGALEEIAGDDFRLEGLLRDGLRLAADGTDRQLLSEMLSTQMKTQVQAYETRCRMIISGIASLQTGDNPRLVDHKLASFYRPRI